jgi:DNA-binding MarR family transcriptional regulator
LQDSQISLPQLTLLDWIAVNPGCNLREIADGLSLTPPTVSVAVRRLENYGYLVRERDPVDGRAVRFTLTPQGYHLYERALSFRQKKMQLLLRDLTPSETETLLTLLDKGLNTFDE